MHGIQRFLSDAAERHLAVSGPLSSGGLDWAIIDSYEVVTGRFAGQRIRIAVPIPPDYPMTPPGGLYISPWLVEPPEMAARNIQERPGETSALPGAWQYWSRPIPPGTWQSENGVKRLVTHWNAVLTNVN
jgi:Prokaryotic E2 family E